MLTIEEMHEQHVDRAKSARVRFKEVLGENPDINPTLGKHEALNHVRLKETLEEAWEKCPNAASTIAWFIWWAVLDAQQLALMSNPQADV